MLINKKTNQADQLSGRKPGLDYGLKDQKGTAMIIVLCILVMLALLGIAAIYTSTSDMSISQNSKLKTQAFYAAEAGLSHAISSINYGNKLDSGTVPLTVLSGNSKYTASWTQMDPITGIKIITATGYVGDANSPDAKAILEEKVEITDSYLDNVITIPNFGWPVDDDEPLELDENVQVLGKIRIDAPPGEDGYQVSMEDDNGVQVAGAINIIINGTTYVAKVNNPVNDGTPNQFTITIAGINYNGTVTWDNASNPTTGTGTVTVNGINYSGIAKPGVINMTGGPTAYQGPTTASGNLGYLNTSQAAQPPPDLSASTVTSLGIQGAATGGYTPPAGQINFANGNLNVNKTGGGNIQYYNGNTHTIDFTVIPGGILYLPGGFEMENNTVYFKGTGTIVSGGEEIEIEKSLLPAPGYEEVSSIGLVSSGEVEIEGENEPITVYAHIFSKSEGDDAENEIEDGVTFYGTIVAPILELEGDDDHNSTTTKIYYRRPKGIIPGFAYLASKYTVELKKGSWMEKL